MERYEVKKESQAGFYKPIFPSYLGLWLQHINARLLAYNKPRILINYNAEKLFFHLVIHKLSWSTELPGDFLKM